jgi:endonuclease/exonuclease/phosphatase family metal-dependent hydrolase
VRLRVVTLNVWNTEGDPSRGGLINAELRRLDPDLVAFVEVVKSAERDQLAELIEGTGLHGTHELDVLATAPPDVDRYGGNAVATRWPHRVVEELDLRLPDAPDLPWCTLAAAVPLPGEGELLFIATCLAWRMESEAARERQAVAVTDLDERRRTDLPSIIAGDFNATPDAACMRYFTGLQSLGGRSVYYHDAWAVAGEGPGYTWTGDNPNTVPTIESMVGAHEHRRRIDYVLVGGPQAHPKAACRIVAAELAFHEPVDGIWPSDHLGVVADLEIGLKAG